MVLTLIPLPTGIGQPIYIQRVAAEHTAHGVGEQRNNLVPLGADIVRSLHALRHIVLGVVDAVDGDILVCHLRGQLVPEAVDVDEDAVQLFLVDLELQKPLLALGFPRGIGIRQPSRPAH